MRFIPEIRPAGLLVISPAELAEIREDLEAGPEICLLAIAELAQLLRAASLGADRDPLRLLELVPGTRSRVRRTLNGHA